MFRDTLERGNGETGVKCDGKGDDRSEVDVSEEFHSRTEFQKSV